MKPDEEPNLEVARVQALSRYKILHTGAESDFDDLCGLAARLCSAPIALIAFADRDRLWLKSATGLDAAELPLRGTVWESALRGDSLPSDLRTANGSPPVPGTRIAFLAAIPLVSKSSSSGQSVPIGLLAVLDPEPRTLDAGQWQGLRTLARQVTVQLDLRENLEGLRQKQSHLETALQHSEAFYQSLVETIPQNIFRKDLRGRFTFANSRFCATVNRPLSEIIGQTDFDLFPPELAAKYQQDDRTVIEKNISLGTVEQHLDAAGNTLFVQVIKAPLHGANGELTGVQGIFWDETDRYKAEEALASERDLLRAMLDHLPDSVYFKDRHSRFMAISRSLAIRLGLKDPAEAEGKTDADFFEQDHAREALADEERIIRTGEPIVAKPERESWADGRERWVLTTKVPLRNRQGEIRGTFGISTDITEIKTAEAELAKARDSALESARVKSEFLANMSHEIRTPLNAVIGMTGLLMETPLAPDQRDFAETIRNSADALLDVINDILDFSKIEAGKMSIESVDFDLAEVVEGTVDLLAEAAQSKGIELASWIQDSAPRFLRGDPGRLRQVLINLVGNAVKFTKEGEVVVHVSLVRELGDGVTLHFSVRDTGIGIPEEARGRLFQAFAQADGSTTRRYGGTGLGLAISRQLVTLMHGEIGFESTEGQGSHFWFALPFGKQPRPSMLPQMASTLEGVRVLIIDDNETNRQILQRQALSWRMRNAAAEGGRSGLSLLQEAAQSGDPYQVVILDMQMPEMDGLTLARAIKTDPRLNSAQLVMLTSMGHLPEERRWREAGIAAYLVKPVKEIRLFDTLVSVLRGADISPSPIPSPAPGPDPSTRAVRILIAEDNVVNQKVALRQMQKLGFSADAVANGLEVLDAIRNVPYDIILMDCQMPDLDGYEATRLLRGEERQRAEARLKHYIIAMTANALEGDREECLTAGMDDYISKPVRLPELEAALRRALFCLDAARADGDLLDLETLQSVRDLRNPGEPDPLPELIDLFLEDAPGRISKILDDFKRSDLASLERSAHTLKGSASNLGAKSLAAACLEILTATRAAKLPESSVVARLLSEFEKLKPALEQQKSA